MISPQGYNYGEDPKANNPFWSDEDIADNLTATATVDNSTGTPSVDVTKNGYNLNFAFKNLKGEKGDRGEKGETGPKGPAGEPGADGKNGTSVIVSKIDTPESGAVVGRITGLKSQELDPTIPGNYETIEVRNGEKGEKGEKGETGATPDITATATVDNTTGTPAVDVTKNGYNLNFAFKNLKGEKGDKGEKGETGPKGPAGEPGKDANISECVTNVFVTNNGKTYTIKQTKGNGTTTNSGDIIVSGVDLFTTQWMYPQPQLSNKYNFPSTAPANGKYFLMKLMFRVDNPTDPNTNPDSLTHIIVAKADSSYVRGFEIVTGETIDFLIGTQSKTIIENTGIFINENPFTGNANGSMAVNYISDDGTEREIRDMSLWYEGVIS